MVVIFLFVDIAFSQGVEWVEIEFSKQFVQTEVCPRSRRSSVVFRTPKTDLFYHSPWLPRDKRNLEVFNLSKYKKNITLGLKIRILLTRNLMWQKLGKFLCRKVYFHLKKLRKEILDRSWDEAVKSSLVYFLVKKLFFLSFHPSPRFIS